MSQKHPGPVELDIQLHELVDPPFGEYVECGGQIGSKYEMNLKIKHIRMRFHMHLR